MLKIKKLLNKLLEKPHKFEETDVAEFNYLLGRLDVIEELGMEVKAHMNCGRLHQIFSRFWPLKQYEFFHVEKLDLTLYRDLLTEEQKWELAYGTIEEVELFLSEKWWES